MHMIPRSAEQLVKFSDKELRNYHRNAKSYGRSKEACRAAKLMHTRDIASPDDLDCFDWNQRTVREAMHPFKEIALAVEDNQRTAYTEAGGFRIGRAKDHPEKLWIDTYCAVKTPSLKAVFACHVKTPGDEPTFVLQLDGATYETYGYDRRDEALREWRGLAVGTVTIDRFSA